MKQRAFDKLNQWLKENKNAAAQIIINELLGRCEESASLCEDVCNDKKTWKGCSNYIATEAKKQASNGCAFIDDPTVFEWAEDYFHSQEPDKADVPVKVAKVETPKKNTAPKTKEPTKQITKEPAQRVIGGQLSLF